MIGHGRENGTSQTEKGNKHGDPHRYQGSYMRIFVTYINSPVLASIDFQGFDHVCRLSNTCTMEDTSVTDQIRNKVRCAESALLQDPQYTTVNQPEKTREDIEKLQAQYWEVNSHLGKALSSLNTSHFSDLNTVEVRSNIERALSSLTDSIVQYEARLGRVEKRRT